MKKKSNEQRTKVKRGREKTKETSARCKKQGGGKPRRKWKQGEKRENLRVLKRHNKLLAKKLKRIKNTSNNNNKPFLGASIYKGARFIFRSGPWSSPCASQNIIAFTVSQHSDGSLRVIIQKRGIIEFNYSKDPDSTTLFGG